jgi:hypothetical protein
MLLNGDDPFKSPSFRSLAVDQYNTNLVYGMEWVRHNDRYDDQGFVDPNADKIGD